MSQDFEKKFYIECQCSHRGHLLVLDYDSDIGLTVHTQLNYYQSLWKRIRNAVRFVLKLDKSDCCGWDETILRDADVAKVREWLSLYDQFGKTMDDFEASEFESKVYT